MNTLDFMVFLVALVGSAFFSGIETGVVSINRLRLQHLLRRGLHGADIIQRFVDSPDHLLGTTLVGTNLCNVIISVTSASLAVRWLGEPGYWVASLASTMILLMLGEYLPKAWFRAFPAYRVLPFARLLQWSGYLFYPLSSAVMQLAKRLIPPRRDRNESGPSFITREELAFLAREGEQSGALSRDEHRMLHGVMQLSRKTCGDLMIPRGQMITVQPDTPADEMIEISRARRFSRLPIYDPASEQFTGFVHITDVLLSAGKEQGTASDYARPPQRVDTNCPADQLLQRMRVNRQPLALVHDAKKRVTGLISIEDILEEIVGML